MDIQTVIPPAGDSNVDAAARRFSVADFIALASAVLMLIAFVALPWANLKDGSATGLGLLSRPAAQASTAIYLIPIAAIIGGLVGAVAFTDPSRRRAASLWGFLPGLVALAYYGITLFQTTQKPVPINYIGIGFWLALLGALGLIVQIAIPRSTLDRPYIGLSVKLLIIFTLLFSVIFAGAYIWFYSFATNVAKVRIVEDLRNTLRATANGVDGDAFDALAKEGKPRADGLTDDPRYWEHEKWLARIIDIEPRALTYSYVRGEKPGEVVFIGSCSWLGDCGKKLDPGAGAKFKEHYIADTNFIVNGLLAESIYAQQPYTDKWGSWISGYTPIKNSKGQIVGAIGVDFEASYLLQVQQAVLSSTVPAILVTYTVLFVLVLAAARLFTQPIVRLTRVAEQIGEGNYDQDLSGLRGGPSRDEIGILAQVFEFMLGKIREREETLKQQVQELKIEIDEVKRTKQVGEIVESEFFKDLQNKARNIRARSQGQTQPQSETPGQSEASAPAVDPSKQS